jgi:hypothetical protein
MADPSSTVKARRLRMDIKVVEPVLSTSGYWKGS